MNFQHVRKVRRAGAVALLASSLVFSVAACGGDDEGSDKAPPAASSDTGKSRGTDDTAGDTLPDRSKTLATLKNDEGIDMVVYSAKRDSADSLP